MKRLLRILGAAVVAAGLSTPVLAESTIVAPGQSTTGTYMDYMKTVYARATFAELLQVPLTSFDKDFKLTALAAESWKQSEDGLTWTFKLRDGLVWSDGQPLTATDYVFALQRAATNGYDFAWYWDFAGGIKNWKEVTEGKADVSTLGIKAVDDKTIEVTTVAPKPYLPSVVSLWYPVPKHSWDKLGDDWASNIDTVISSGPFTLADWEKSNNTVTLQKNAKYTGPWQAQVDKLEVSPPLGAPEVGLPAFLAGDADYSYLNTGQVPVVKQRYPDGLRKNAVFAVSYISFDLNSKPFDNVDVRKALYYAVDRNELTNTVLKDIAIPAGSLLAPGYPGYNADIAAEAKFDPEKAKAFMAKAGYPNGEGFPDVEIWYRDEGGYNSAIVPPMAQYLQAAFKKTLGINMSIRSMQTKDWMDGLLKKKNNLFIAPYEYDYLDPSNFYGLFYNGGRHDHHVAKYDELVAAADSNSNWDERLKLYAQAEQVLIDNASIVPLVHPVTIAVISDQLKGDASQPNAQGFTPLDRLGHYFFTHLQKQ
ncbi:MAG: peptide ABC transporter substrate-binding protein [Candidatus Kaistia colombiensis]|nr:MAG: peptide ABC transporter substrate-binding protein [Kaistia sp.]